MSPHRFFLASALPAVGDGVGDTVDIPLSDPDLHHAARVLRVRPGEEIVVVEPDSRARIVEISSVSADAIAGRVVRDVAARREPHITLVQGITKGSSMDEIIQHAVELGAEHVVPFLAERTVVRLDEEKAAARTARWQRISEGAARQSQRSRVPRVHHPKDIEGVVAMLGDHEVAAVLWEGSGAKSLPEVLASAGVTREDCRARVALVIGPEGGLTEAEVSTLTHAGAVAASLGGAILRAETAALVAMTLTAHTLGSLEPSVVRAGDENGVAELREESASAPEES